MSGVRWSEAKYLAYLAARRRERGGSAAVAVSGGAARRARGGEGWSGPEARYFAGVLHGDGEYEGEEIRITPAWCEEHHYTPDFVTRRGDGVVVYHEVKGSYRLGSQAAARLRWTFAALARSAAIFVWAKEGRNRLWTVDIWRAGGRLREHRTSVVGFSFSSTGETVWQVRQKQKKRKSLKGVRSRLR